MRSAQGPARPTGGVTATPTFVNTPTVIGAITTARCRLEVIRQTDLGCTTWRGMFGSGRKIAGTEAMRAHPTTERLGRRKIVMSGFCAAARGTTMRASFAPLSATGATPAIATIPSASVLRERHDLLHLNPFTSGGSKGAQP